MTRWIPCPWCGDDNTFAKHHPTGPRRCGCCCRYVAIVREGTHLRAMRTYPVHPRRSRPKPPRKGRKKNRLRRRYRDQEPPDG